MKKDKLDCIGYVDAALIERAEYTSPARRHPWTSWGIIAACLCLCIVGALKTQSAPQGPDMGSGTDVPMPGSSNTFEHPAAEGKEGNTSMCTVIAHYDRSLNSADMAVRKEHFVLSNSLEAAIDEYGDSAVYRVVVEVFKNGTVINSGSEEVKLEEERLAREHYTVAHERFEDSTDAMDYFTLHAEKDQLLHFSANKAYGYYISFYDEYLGLEEQQDDAGTVYHSPMETLDQSADDSFREAAEYPADILEMQQAISGAMARGELPYVYTSCICEDPLRIEVGMDTQDRALIESFMAAYDPAGKYVVMRGAQAAAKE